MKIKCPTCREEFNYFSRETRPFCSERCKMIDLGTWFSEGNTISSEEPLSEKDLERVVEHNTQEEE